MFWPYLSIILQFTGGVLLAMPLVHGDNLSASTARNYQLMRKVMTVRAMGLVTKEQYEKHRVAYLIYVIIIAMILPAIFSYILELWLNDAVRGNRDFAKFVLIHSPILVVFSIMVGVSVLQLKPKVRAFVMLSLVLVLCFFLFLRELDAPNLHFNFIFIMCFFGFLSVYIFVFAAYEFYIIRNRLGSDVDETVLSIRNLKSSNMESYFGLAGVAFLLLGFLASFVGGVIELSQR